MSDLEKRNRQAMIDTLRSVHAQQEELEKKLTQTSAALSGALTKIASLEQEVIMLKLASRGNGPTT